MTNEKLFKAVETCSIENVKQVIVEERINAMSHYGAKSIIFAVENGPLDILKVLLESGAGVPRLSFWSNSYKIALSAISKAIHNGRLDILRLLFEYEANVNKSDLRKAFADSFLSRNLELTKILIDAGANVNLKDIHGISPLMYCIYFPIENQELILKWLVEAGAHVNVKCEYVVEDGKRKIIEKSTALKYAKKHCDPKIVELLQNAKSIRNAAV